MIEIILEHFVKSLYEFVYGGAIWRVVYKYLSNVCVSSYPERISVLKCPNLHYVVGEREKEKQ